MDSPPSIRLGCIVLENVLSIEYTWQVIAESIANKHNSDIPSIIP
jgi:hypothetical protein